MNVYHIHPVADNRMFEGLALSLGYETFSTWPRDWQRHSLTWESKSLKAIWRTPAALGRVRLFNDYPCINLTEPAFSQRAVDLLHHVLETKGELLPVQHQTGFYYYFNCTCLANVIDVSRSGKSGSGCADINSLKFFEEKLSDLVIFKDRNLPPYQLCTQRFVDQFQSAGLQGIIFIRVWPHEEGSSYHAERYRLCQLARKLKPNPWVNLEVNANTVIVRLCCQNAKPTELELAKAESVIAKLDERLLIGRQMQNQPFDARIESIETANFEVRISLTASDRDQLLCHLLPAIGSLPWPGNYFVVKRRDKITNGQTSEEYIPVK